MLERGQREAWQQQGGRAETAARQQFGEGQHVIRGQARKQSEAAAARERGREPAVELSPPPGSATRSREHQEQLVAFTPSISRIFPDGNPPPQL
jgi:hypothetical protein